MNITPQQAISHFRNETETGAMSKRDAQMALKRWAQTGHAWIVRGNVKFVWTEDAFGCDCGKGLLCPAINQRPVVGRKSIPFRPNSSTN